MRQIYSIKEFFKLESASGIILCCTALLAIICVNSPLHDLYGKLLSVPILIGFGKYQLEHSLLHWVNDGLMTIFFVLVGLEIKREMIEGELSRPSQRILPGIAALGGMLIPALIFIAFNRHGTETIRGWAIPCATDIAFSLAVLSMLGKLVPNSIRVFLTALAIFDDLGAIIIIALFYTSTLNLHALMLASVVLLALIVLNRLGVRLLLPYILLGFLLWFLILKSGVHATIAGVALALTIPGTQQGGHSPLKQLEHALHPWVAFIIVPIFGFVNSGLFLGDLSISSLLDPVPIGIILGLYVGKQLGIFGATYLTIRSKLAPMPTNANWGDLYAVSTIAGIGFTMSLFIGSLAYRSKDLLVEVQLGVIVGSLLSGVTGYFIYRIFASHND